MILDTKLNFQGHIINILNKVNKTIGLLRKLQNILPRAYYLQYLNHFLGLTLIMVMLHMAKAINNTSLEKIESIQYSAALAITDAIRGSSREKLYPRIRFGIRKLKTAMI